MLSNITLRVRSLQKQNRLVYPVLSALVLALIISPALAAPGQARPAQWGSEGSLFAAATGNSATQASPYATCPPDGQCFTDVPPSNPFYTFVNRIYQQDLVSGYACGGTGEPCDPLNRPYYRPGDNVTRQQMAKFIDNARRLPDVHIETSSISAPVYVSNTYTNGIGIFGYDPTGVGMQGVSVAGWGVEGTSTSNYGVFGVSSSSSGVRGASTSGAGVSGQGGTGAVGVSGIGGARGVYGQSDSGFGVFGYAPTGVGVEGDTTTGMAGFFHGNVQVTGNLSKGGGSFKIDDPIDPANKYLYHSFVESPDMMDIYNGNITLDSKGEAWVQMADWFQPLNRDFRYQLTAIGGPGPNLYIAQTIQGNHFKIAGGSPGLQVSWQVTGIRQDPYANAHRIPVEETKPANEKGKYLYPTEMGLPASTGIYQSMQQQQSKP